MTDTITVKRELLQRVLSGFEDYAHLEQHWHDANELRAMLSAPPVESASTDNTETLRNAIERIRTLEGLIATIKHRCHLPDWARDAINKAL